MKIVERAENAPGTCIFTQDIDGPYLDLERWVNWVDPYAYVHVPFVKEMGRAVGMVDPAEVEALRKRIEEMGDEIAELRLVARVVTNIDENERVLEKLAA